MKTKRSIFISALIALVILILLGLSLPAVSAYRTKAKENATFKAMRALPLDRLKLAVEAYSNKSKVGSGSIPDTVSIRELVSGGYLKAEEAGALNQMEAFASLKTSEFEPSAILLRVSAGTRWFVMLQDGSMAEK